MVQRAMSSDKDNPIIKKIDKKNRFKGFILNKMSKKTK